MRSEGNGEEKRKLREREKGWREKGTVREEDGREKEGEWNGAVECVVWERLKVDGGVDKKMVDVLC